MIGGQTEPDVWIMRHDGRDVGQLWFAQNLPTKIRSS
jgi:hypothetical protein